MKARNHTIADGKLAVALAALLPLSAVPREPTPDLLPKILQKHPEADANKDGVLTLEEANAWIQGNKSAKKAKSASAGTFATTQAPAKSPWVWSNPKEPAGTKIKTFHSATIDQDVSYLVWLPPGYNPDDAQTRYPVIYFLHGGGGNYEHIPAAFLPQAAAAIKDRKMPPVIGVMVNGLSGSLYVDSADGRTPAERIIMRDLVPHIDAAYRTNPAKRALEGFSMGGYGVTHLAFKYPETFIGVADFAGAVQGWEFFGRVPNISQPWGGEERFLAEWPFTLARKNAEAIRRNIRQMFIAVGDRDTGRGSTLDSNTKLHGLLDELKIPNQFIIVPGVKHSYQNLSQDASVIEKHLQFYQDLFGSG